jgi:hypothetical protein
MIFLRIVIASTLLLEHDLFPKTGIRFFGIMRHRCTRSHCRAVMTGLVPGIRLGQTKTWMAGTSPLSPTVWLNINGSTIESLAITFPSTDPA